MTDRIRLAFVDDHPTLLRGLATVFGSDERYSIVATGASADEALVIAADSQPDVIILDLSMPGDVFAAIDSMTTRSWLLVFVFGVTPPAMLLWLWNEDRPLLMGSLRRRQQQL